MPAPWELPQQILAPLGKSLDTKAPGWGANVWCKSQGVCRGDGYG